jgi:hypothetical protein
MHVLTNLFIEVYTYIEIHIDTYTYIYTVFIYTCTILTYINQGYPGRFV